jgi:beta-glucosidase/6-phospho-beta-glucosidase/beta-galactosidase
VGKLFSKIIIRDVSLATATLQDGSVPELNPDGVAYYNHLIDGLLAKGTTNHFYPLIITR